MIRKFCLFFIFLFPVCRLFAQQDTLRKNSSGPFLNESLQRQASPRFKPAALLLPAVLITYGAIGVRSQSLIAFDHDVRKVIWTNNPHRPVHLDNYLQYAPGAAVYLLDAIGIKGKNNFRDRTILYLAANGLMGATILSLKKWVPAERPDGSGNDGFPSGHTGTAFVAAEFMRQEYKDVSPWYGIGGYVAAAATAYLRMYNDKHWFSELTTGAGIGILSTKIAYWVYPAIKRKLFPNKQPALVALPFYNSGTVGLSATYFIR